MRILRVADVPNNRTSGMARMMHLTSDALRDLGHEVDQLFSEDLGVVRPARLRRFVLPWRVPRLVRRLQRASGPYDVVEIHEPLSAGYALTRSLGLTLPPLVVLSHGLEARAHETKLAQRRRRGLPISLRERLFPLATVWQANRGLKGADAVICLNRDDQAYLETLGIASERVFRIENGIEASFLRAGVARVIDRLGQRILFCGTWIERKGIGELVPAVMAALARFSAARFTVAGCGIDAEIVRRCFPHEMQARLDVLPHLASHELIPLYERHDVLILPSHFEGYPLVMLEAAALKLIIIVSATCGMTDFVRDDNNGRLVPPGDADALTRTLHEVLVAHDRRDHWGQAAHHSAQARTWEATARSMEAAFHAALGLRTPLERCTRSHPAATCEIGSTPLESADVVQPKAVR